MCYKIISLSNATSYISLLISFATFIYVWRKDQRETHLIKLKHDKSILYPLLQENYDFFLSTSEKYDTEKLLTILNLLKIDNLYNQEVKEKIITLRNAKIVFLDDKKNTRTVDGNLENLFIEIRFYLSEII